MTQERRSDCLAHASLEATLGSMNEKIDLILERQLEYSNRITKLETIVTNGMSHNIIEIREKLETVCEQYGKRLTVLESFAWFRNSVNNIRDNLFMNLIRLAVIGGVTYVSVPDSIILPAQPEQITVEEVELTDELKESIKSESPHVQLINERVVAKIREIYSLNDEIKMIRLSPSEESTAYNEYVEACREWGRVAKANLGL